MREVATIGWTLPERWHGWAHGDPAAAAQSASGLADEASRARLAAAVRRFERLIDDELPGTSCAGMWVPEGSGGGPLASAVLRVFASTPASGSRVEAILERARSEITLPAGVRLLDVTALPGWVSAGDAVLQIVDTAPRFGRRISREWSWFILVPGTDDLLLVHVESSAIAHFDELADMATDIANSVVVTLGPP